MGRGGFVPRHTEEEKEWAKETVAGINEKITGKVVERLNLLIEYRRKFGKTLGVSGMTTWLRRTQDPEYGKNLGKSEKRKSASTVFSKSNYIMWVEGGGVFGFDTLDEVKEAISKSKLSEVRLFKNIGVKVEYSVQINE